MLIRVNPRRAALGTWQNRSLFTAMNDQTKTLPTIAEKAGQIVREIIERELSNNLGRFPTRLSVEAIYPESWVGEDPRNARDESGEPCVVGVSLDDDGYDNRDDE